jgi:hypothetical protein
MKIRQNNLSIYPTGHQVTRAGPKLAAIVAVVRRNRCEHLQERGSNTNARPFTVKKIVFPDRPSALSRRCVMTALAMEDLAGMLLAVKKSEFPWE